MGIHRGLNIVRDGLVFGYDTGYGAADNTTATRFYLGKPISNSINGGENRANVVTAPMHGSHGASVTTEIISYGARKNVFRIYSTNTSGYYMVNQQSSIINTSGNVYTYSFDYKKIKGTSSSFSPSAFYKNGYKTPDSGSAASNITDTIVDLEDGWKRLTRTYTSTYTGYNFYRTNLNTNNTLDFEYLFDNFMVNEGVAVPFVDGTRSSTQSLIDLKRTTNIDVSNVSFDSTGQPTFDGTNDQINLDSSASIIPYGDVITVEAVVKWDDLVPNGVVVSYGGNQSGAGFLLQNEFSAGLEFVLFDGNGNSGRAKILSANSSQYLDEYIHMVGVYDGSNIRLYINGAQAASASYTNGYPQQSYFRIGNEYNRSYYANIDLSVVKIYSKALTAAEVQQNFNAYKNRFNI